VTAPLTTEFGPCGPWPVRWLCDVTTTSPVVTAQAVQFATEVIWALSGRQFGLCTVTLRPCKRDCLDGLWLGGWSEWLPGATWPQPALIGGNWFNLTCGGGCGDTCSCTALSEAELPAPVHRIIQVKIDGTPLATGAYRVDENRFLVRTDGGQWPFCNDLTRDDTQVGTWSVTAEFGQSVPESGAWAVGELACQFINAVGGGDCRLPRNVTQLIRQGVTIQFPSIIELFTARLTGFYLVDTFIQTWNPGRLQRRSRTYRVDGPQARRTNT